MALTDVTRLPHSTTHSLTGKHRDAKGPKGIEGHPVRGSQSRPAECRRKETVLLLCVVECHSMAHRDPRLITTMTKLSRHFSILRERQCLSVCFIP